MMIIGHIDIAVIFQLGRHRLGALYPPNGPNAMEVEWGAGDQGRERGQA